MTKKPKPDPKNTDQGRGDIGGGLFNSLTGFLENLGDLTKAGERLSMRHAAKPETTGTGPGVGGKAGGENRFSRILSGLTDLAEKLNEISEKGESLSKTGEFTCPSKEGGVKGVYGFSLKTGLGGRDDQIRVEPFGNIRRDEKTGRATVQEVHEPLVDIFEEDEATTLVAEMPGVGLDDIRIHVRDDVLTVFAEKGEKKYRKELLLHHTLSREKINVTCNNGIVTIRCEKVG